MSMIEFIDVSLKYPNGTEALKNISLLFEKGEFAFIMGGTGSGKSSLMKLIYREEVPSKGEVYINNHDITELPRTQIPYIRRKIGVIFQDFKLLDYKTVAENVAYALEVTGHPPDKIKDKVEMVLGVVGMAEKKDMIPEQISGGEKQLTSIARAIVHNPPILLADEPTGNLDPESKWNIINILDYISSRGTTVLVATHDTEVSTKMKRRVVYLKDGAVLSDQGKISPIPDLLNMV